MKKTVYFNRVIFGSTIAINITCMATMVGLLVFDHYVASLVFLALSIVIARPSISLLKTIKVAKAPVIGAELEKIEAILKTFYFFSENFSKKELLRLLGKVGGDE